MLLGVVGYVVALPQMRFDGVVFDAHTLLFASLFLYVDTNLSSSPYLPRRLP